MTAAALGVFLPVYLFVVLPAPYFRRHRSQPLIKASCFGRGHGAIAGAAYVLATRALVDLWTVAIAVVTFAILTLEGLELWLIAGAAAFGLLVRT